MKSITLPQYSINIVRAVKGMEIREMETPEPEENQVLIKMLASPCNPSDISFIQGRYGVQKPLPATPGFEATGMVIKTGSNSHAKSLLGKRVSCFTQLDKYGTWSEEFIALAIDCIPVIDELPDEQAACLSINPLTAMALFDEILKYDMDSVIVNTAESQVVKMLKKIPVHSRNALTKSGHLPETDRLYQRQK